MFVIKVMDNLQVTAIIRISHFKMFTFLRCYGAVEASEDETSFFTHS